MLLRPTKVKYPDNQDSLQLLDIFLAGDQTPAKNEWLLGKYGVLGLSPSSNFWNYLKDNFDHGEANFGLVSLVYNIEKKSEKFEMKDLNKNFGESK